MKQIIQNFKTGETKFEEVPPPVHALGFDELLIETRCSLVSLLAWIFMLVF